MNLFFSVLAGSTGGLIGVISAFLISKILTREEKFLIIEENIELAIIKAEKYKQTLDNIDMKSFIEDSRKKGVAELIDEFSIDSKKENIDYANEYFSKYDDFKEISTLIEKEVNNLYKAKIDKIVNDLKLQIENDYPNIKSKPDYLTSIKYPLKIKEKLLSEFNFELEVHDIIRTKIFETIKEDNPDFKSLEEYLSLATPYLKNVVCLRKSIEDKISDLKKNPYSPFLKNFDSLLKESDIFRNSLLDLKPQMFNQFNLENISDKQRIEIEEFIKINKLLSKKTNGFNLQKKEMNYFLIIIFSFFIIGIIYPLSFLKYSENALLDYSLNNFFHELNSITGLILLVMTIIFTVFIGRMAWINNKLHFTKEKLDKFNKIYTFEYYSIYLKNYKTNSRQESIF